jgi:hypothetical protein
MARPPVDHPEPFAEYASHPLQTAWDGGMGASVMSDLICLAKNEQTAADVAAQINKF